MRLGRPSVAAALVLALAGCEPAGGGFTFFSSQPTGPQVTQVDVMGGALNVATPAGFCIDTRASRPADGFVVEVGCALVARNGVVPAADGLLTVQVGEAGSAVVNGAERELKQLLLGESGQALLAGDGPASAVSVKRVNIDEHVVTAFLNVAPTGALVGLQPVEWRGFFDIGDRLVTIRLRGYERAPLSEVQGRTLLRDAIAALMLAN